MQSLSKPVALLAMMVLATLGCSGSSDSADGSDDGSEIIDGRPDTRTTAAIGALVEQFNLQNGPGYRAFCTATLIAPKLVLTAKHCREKAFGKWGFAMGEHANTEIATGRGPKRVVLADRFEEESTVTGRTALGLGSDVALVHLHEAITDVEPLPVALLTDADIGKTFTAIGYGLQKDLTTTGARRSGTITLKARSGLVLAPLVSAADYDRRSGGDSAENLAYHARTKLLDDYEASLAPGNAQPCTGDSGGPLLSKRNGKFRVFGVASYALGSAVEPCIFGTVYATFGPAAKTMIDRGLASR